MTARFEFSLRRPTRGQLWRVGGGVVLLIATAVGTTVATASTSRGPLKPSTVFFTPQPATAALAQVQQLAQAGNTAAANAVQRMLQVPQAVWFTGSSNGAPDSPASIQYQVSSTIADAASFGQIPILVAFNIPGNECSTTSLGGATTTGAFQTWINAFAQGLGQSKALVLLNPDSLAMLPSSCYNYNSGNNPNFPYTDQERIQETQYAVNALSSDPNAYVYLDGGNPSWQSVNVMAARLTQANVSQTRGFFLNVANHQYTANNVAYGNWLSSCIYYATSIAPGNFNNCPSQFNAPEARNTYNQLSPYGAWNSSAKNPFYNIARMNLAYAALLGGASPKAHFVIDTSRNGAGENPMTLYAAAPYNQPSIQSSTYVAANGTRVTTNRALGVIATLQQGYECNQPGSKVGPLPSANTRTISPLLDAFLWVKNPGSSDEQCGSQENNRAWNYAKYSAKGWPTSPGNQANFDPLWGTVDPPAGSWFPAAALMYAQSMPRG